MNRRDLLKTMMALPAGVAAASAEPIQSYQPDWSSLDARPIPSWYTDAKFGIFIHWGVYSVPAFAEPHMENQNPYAEWYWHSLRDGKKATSPTGAGAATWKFHQRVYGADFTYFQFAPMFRAELWDPDAWADAIAGSGARYVALTSKHHEGFTLWRSAQANNSWQRQWNSVDIGPKRDLLLDLMLAGRRKNLHMGIYYSLYEWFNPLYLYDKKRYVTDHLFPQFKDVVNHAKPDIIFSDGEWELTSAQWRSPELLAWLYNESPVKDYVVVDDRWGKDTRHKHGGYYTTEYTNGMHDSTHPWEESRGMGFSYGYNRNETLADYHTGRQLLLMLIDIVSRGGNFLLDIGPRADGRIPAIMAERLSQIGNWLRPHGEAIYGTKAWDRAAQWSAGQMPHFEQKEYRAPYSITQEVDQPPAGHAHIEAFFTSKNGVVYAIVPHRPKGDFVLRDVAASSEAHLVLLHPQRPLPWHARGRDLVVSMPAGLPKQEAYVIKMTGVRSA